MTTQVDQRPSHVHSYKPIPNLTSTKQNQKINQPSQGNTSQFQVVTGLQQKSINNARQGIAEPRQMQSEAWEIQANNLNNTITQLRMKVSILANMDGQEGLRKTLNQYISELKSLQTRQKLGEDIKAELDQILLNLKAPSNPKSSPKQTSKQVPTSTSTKRNQKVSQPSQTNKCEFKNFTDLQVKVTRQAIENTRKITKFLNQDIITCASGDKNIQIMFVNLKCLNKPYKTGVRSIEDLPEAVRKNFDLKKYEIHFATPHAMAEASTLTFKDAKEEFPTLEEIKSQVSNLKPHEDILYGLIVNGVSHAFFPPTKEQQALEKFEKLKLKELLTGMNSVEGNENGFDKNGLVNRSRIVSRQALKLTREYADIALKNFPEAFENKSIRDWKLSKVQAVAEDQI
jgi:hypothetical protein